MILDRAAKANHGCRAIVWAVVSLGLSGLVACGGPPQWVKQGSGVYHEGGEKAIYGVGAVVGIRNEPLAWETAENRARAELAKTFQTYTAYLMEDYAASTNAGDASRVAEEQHVERAIKTFTAVTLNGVRPVDRYKDEEAHGYYVLTRLSFREMKDALQQAKELDAEVREFVKQHAERALERLEQEEAKHRPTAQPDGGE